MQLVRLAFPLRFVFQLAFNIRIPVQRVFCLCCLASASIDLKALRRPIPLCAHNRWPHICGPQRCLICRSLVWHCFFYGTNKAERQTHSSHKKMPADKQSDTVNTRMYIGTIDHGQIKIKCQYAGGYALNVAKSRQRQKPRQTAAKYKQRFLNVVIKMKWKQMANAKEQGQRGGCKKLKTFDKFACSLSLETKGDLFIARNMFMTRLCAAGSEGFAFTGQLINLWATRNCF